MFARWLPLLAPSLFGGCLYDANLPDPEPLVSCAKHDDCGTGLHCSGMVSTSETCFEDGWVGAADSGVFLDPPANQDSIFFQCDGGRRYYSYCTAGYETTCDADVCGTEFICGKPLDGSTSRTYGVALRNGSDGFWQCNPDLSCGDTAQVCLRMFEFEVNGYKINRRVCVPRTLVRIPPAWAAPK
jgi:hypothetical protein